MTFSYKNLTVHIASCLKLNDDIPVLDEELGEKHLTVEFNYPLSQPVLFQYEDDKGFTLRTLVQRICETYQEIYEEERETTKAKEGRAGRLFNRNKTDGRYGIWGHALGDLFIEGVELGEDGIVRLLIGS